ncbi:hypothetical protein E0W68_03225 [Flavobacterium salilacus subsp. salilacus]|uniref:hypothetical protein n=1 Tax=Flavobacterium TaxID=237 RepID=UPI0010757481|nr:MULTISPECIES: hypothetical protein [Flavobacterium]KAF2519372.1 hypothetical protein E0W68_03225 [Flavobacterium salilacus subsp. salilacus]MBE1614736.1 hypothetical protein [Flavobacterium sp. SaA2.13]
MKRMNVSVESVMRFIIDNELTDSVAIVLHPNSFDALAIDYIAINGNIERPFEVLGIKILEDTSGEVSRNQIHTIKI